MPTDKKNRDSQAELAAFLERNGAHFVGSVVFDKVKLTLYLASGKTCIIAEFLAWDTWEVYTPISSSINKTDTLAALDVWLKS